MNGKQKLVWLAVFAIAMGLLEAAVVVYLRELYYPENVLKIFPAKMFTIRDLKVELSREISTMVMLFAVGWLVERSFWRRFAAFITIWGIWDIAYYFWLKVIIGWPLSLTEFDILFLIPVAWIGPVMAPMMIALTMAVGGGVVVLDQRIEPKVDKISVAAVALGATTDFLCFVYPSIEILMKQGTHGFLGFVPASFPWPIFILGWLAFSFGVSRTIYLAKNQSMEVKNG